jgi:hypothetical protein
MFCIWHFITGAKVLSTALFIFLIINISMLISLKDSNKYLLYRISTCCLVAMTLLLVYLFPEVHIYYMFFLVLPVLFFLLLGKNEGRWWSAITVIPITLMYFFKHAPQNHGSGSSERLILYLSIFSAYFAISYLAYLMEDMLLEAYSQENEYRKEITQKHKALEQAIKEIKTLKETLPVCSNCRKIKDESGEYLRLEEYLLRHTDTKVSHSLCPDCLRELYPEYADEILQAAQKDTNIPLHRS